MALDWQSGSLALISKGVGPEWVLSAKASSDIGLRRPVVNEELNLLNDNKKLPWNATLPPTVAPHHRRWWSQGSKSPY